MLTGGVVLLGLISYLPALNNGFIGDDFVFLERSWAWLNDPGLVFGDPPGGFRATTLLAFLLLQSLAGYQAAVFYIFAIAVHLLNCLLVGRLAFEAAGQFSDSETSAPAGMRALPGRSRRNIAWTAAALMAVIQQPQEAVMWLSAMSDLLAAFFMLLSLLLWTRQRHFYAAALLCAALLSKESALVFPLLAWIFERGILRRRRSPIQWLWLGVPAAVGAGLLFWTLSQNSLVTAGYYEFGPGAVQVLANSLFRLTFPWLFIVLALAGIGLWKESLTSWQGKGQMAWLSLWTAASLLPFIFLTYQNHVPSRHLYLASAGWVILLALLAGKIALPWWRTVFLAAFLAANPAYLWLRKDAQFEERAAPTTELLQVLRDTPPAPLSVSDFPANPWVGRLTTRLIPGWEPDLLTVNDLHGTQPPKIRLRWNGKTYQAE